MAKPLRKITDGKVAGKNSSETKTPDLEDLAMSPKGNKGELDFAAKHKTEVHDAPHGSPKVAKGEASYKKQDKKVYEAACCNHTNEGVMCEVHGDKACPSDDAMPEKKGKKLKLLLDKKTKVNEVLTAKAPAGEWIHDFVHSKNPKFAGKSKEKRKEMALGAYYSKKREGKTTKEQTDTPMNMYYGQAGSTIGDTRI